MPVVSKETLKEYFEDGKAPNEDKYIDLIDTMGDMNISEYDSNDDGIVDGADNADTVDGQHASEFAPSGFGLGTECQVPSESDWNDVITTGFYRGYQLANGPSSSYYYVNVLRHNDSWITQTAYYYYERNVYFRQKDSGVWSAWEPIFPAAWGDITGKPSTYTPSSHTHSGGDITSIVDEANKLDGFHASSFVRADADDTKTGDLRMSGGLVVGSTSDLSGSGKIYATDNVVAMGGLFIGSNLDAGEGNLGLTGKIYTSTPIACNVYNSLDLSIPNNAWTPLTLNSESTDTDNIHSVSSNTSRLTSTRTGHYIITGHIAFEANATGIRGAAIRLNGTAYIAMQNCYSPTSSDDIVLSVSILRYIPAGDYVELMAYQNSGGSLSVKRRYHYSPTFGMARVP